MRPSIEDIRSFVCVVALGSFHQASESLFITPSALSRRISKLENYVGAPLFDRTTQKVALTSVGRELLENSRTLINDFDRFDERLLRIASQKDYPVEIACLTTIAGNALPKLIVSYRQQKPDVRFLVRDGNGMEVTEKVRDRTVEFGVGIKTEEADELELDPICDDQFYLACSPEHPLSKKKKIRWKDLAGHAVIVLGSDTSANRRIIDDQLNRHDVALVWSDEVQSLSTQTGFVDQGIGSAVVPGLSIPFFHNPNVLKIPLIEPVISREVVLMKRKKAPLSPAAKDFYGYIQRNFIEVLS